MKPLIIAILLAAATPPAISQEIVPGPKENGTVIAVQRLGDEWAETIALDDGGRVVTWTVKRALRVGERVYWWPELDEPGKPAPAVARRPPSLPPIQR